MRIGVYSPNWIGDAIMALPFISQLKVQNPNAKISVVCKDWVSGVYEQNPAIDKLITIKNNSLKNVFGTFETGRSLKLKNFDQFYTLTDSFRSAFVLWISGSAKRIGYKAQLRSFLLTNSFNHPKKRIHRSKKFLKLLSNGEGSITNPVIYISKKEAIWAKDEMERLNFSRPVAIFPFSIAENRSISKETIQSWIKNSKADYLIFGSKNDSTKGESIINQCKNNSIKSICGKYSLRESILLISQCHYSLAADSGLGHISAALGVPTISFFGVGYAEKTGPLGKHTSIVRYCSPCKGNDCKNINNQISCIKDISKSEIELYVSSILKL